MKDLILQYDASGSAEICPVTDEVLAKINRLKNKPLKTLTAEDIFSRHIIAIGETPTSHGSIHPERKLNGRDVNVLSQIATLSVGIPMLDGHNKDLAPWGRVYSAEVRKGPECTVVQSFFFPKNTDRGRTLAEEIDTGIRCQWSISYWVAGIFCSICHNDWLRWMMGDPKTKRCEHRLGQKYDSQVCYFYPTIRKMGETSSVYQGAYTKTGNIKNSSEEDQNIAESLLCIADLGGGKTPTIVPTDIPWKPTETGENLEPQAPAGANAEGENHHIPSHLSEGEPAVNPNADQPAASAVAQPEPSSENATPETILLDKATATAAQAVELSGPGDGVPQAASGAGAGASSSDAAPGAEAAAEAGSPAAVATPPMGTIEPPTVGDALGENGAPAETPTGIDPAPTGAEHGAAAPAPAGASADETPAPSAGDGVSDPGPGASSLTPETTPLTPAVAIDAAGGSAAPASASGPEAGSDLAGTYSCECLKCGHKVESEKHCRETKCPKCGGEMRRVERPGVGHDAGADLATQLAQFVADMELPLDSDERRELIDSVAVEVYVAYVDAYGATRECCGCGGEVGLAEECCGVGYAAIKPAKVGRFVGPLKPAKSGAVNNEHFTVDGFASLPANTYFVEPKYDGVYVEAHRKGGKVSLLTESADHAEKFPGVVAELEKVVGGDFALPGEMVKYRGRSRLTHEDVTAYLNGKGPYEDYHFRFKPFDAIVLDGKSLVSLPFGDRRKALDDGVTSGKQIHPTVFTKVEHKVGSSDIERAIRERQTREGAMVKCIDARYTGAGRKLIYKWKRQVEVDARVAAKHAKTGGGFTYTCEVGNGSEATKIGETYATSKEAKVGDILQVSVDHITKQGPGKYTWYAPKVLAVRTDKHEADPVSVVDRIAERKTGGSRRNAEGGARVELGPVVSRLKTLPGFTGADIYVCGGVVEHGFSEHDLDLYSTRELTVLERGLITESVGLPAEYVDFIHGEGAPVGPSVLVLAAGAPADHAWKYAKKFVLQKHWWGRKAHYDLRFGAPSAPRMWGWTCFTEPTQEAGGKKVRCVEKQYHDPKWMDFEGKIKPGQPGNPTKNLDAFMKILDKGSYEFVTRKKGFLEVVLSGKDWNGRYVFREIDVKNSPDQDYAGDDEDKTKGNKIWVMWKTKDQSKGGEVKNIVTEFIGNQLILWEGSDTDIAALADFVE